MLRRAALFAVLFVIPAACATPAGEPTPTTHTAPAAVASPTTEMPSTTSTTATPPEEATSTTTSLPGTTTTTAPSDVLPAYVVAGPGGVFRVVDGVATPAMDRTDVAWAEDDGAGGLVFSTWPTSGTVPIEWLHAGSATPSVIVENVFGCIGYLTHLEGDPHVITVRQAPDPVKLLTVLVDLRTGTERVFESGSHGGQYELRPESMAGSYGVDTEWSMSADVPPGARLVFTDLSGEAISFEHNPWPDICLGCGLWPFLSPDGRLLAVVDFQPEPSDLGVAGWSEFQELEQGEQWTRWFAARRTKPATLRILDLTDGTSLFSSTVNYDPDCVECSGTGDEPFGNILDFDGRFVQLSQCPGSTWPCILDTQTGRGVEIVWGSDEPGTLRFYPPNEG